MVLLFIFWLKLRLTIGQNFCVTLRPVNYKFYTSITMKEALIVSTARTPIGKAYRGAYNNTSAPTMAGIAIKEAVKRAGLTQKKWMMSSWGQRFNKGLPEETLVEWQHWRKLTHFSEWNEY